MYTFGKTSKEKISTCHIDLQKIFKLAISRSVVDFGISEGHRPIEIQKQYYAIGRTVDLHRKPITNIDGVSKLGKHNKIPSEATDFYAYHSDTSTRKKIAYDTNHLSYIYGVLDCCAKELYEKGEITHLLRWGANWDKDGVLYYDQSFDDAPHVELYKP
ncbi:endolysin [Tenacibaculum phage Gundel_1]|uniref:L-Ala-D-Glu peptidase-like protein n=1 Tax=Tenacibaculum phage Gundel_1 TaxID=2745672 RepID=A0A8E5EA49_9CAUD|nr:endolysin [Tenacibaculum phage Gundel_1]QQV91523.1 L-Ala-D-Glu peptidase-like protein [Tenacibaculum phage Gundel_1]